MSQFVSLLNGHMFETFLSYDEKHMLCFGDLRDKYNLEGDAFYVVDSRTWLCEARHYPKGLDISDAHVVLSTQMVHPLEVLPKNPELASLIKQAYLYTGRYFIFDHFEDMREVTEDGPIPIDGNVISAYDCASYLRGILNV